MSDKRQRRKTQRPGGASGRRRENGIGALAEGLARNAEMAGQDADELRDALDAEQWASSLIGTMYERVPAGTDIEAILVPPFVAALERGGRRGALAALRALGAVTRPEHARLAGAAADRLAAAGVPDPTWAGDLGTARPTSAALIHEPAFDDGAGVLVEFETPGAPPHTVAVYIDHNLGGLVKHILLAGPLGALCADAERQTPGELGMAVRDLALAEARGRIASALEVLDRTYEPPVSEDVRAMRAMLDARLRTLPAGFEPAEEEVVLDPEDRAALLADFLVSAEGRRWREDDDAADLVELAIDFGADYNHGGPLRWSPVVVDIFMTSWLPDKVLRERTFFERAPDPLCDWVRYSGRRRGVPVELVREAAGTVAKFRGTMLEAVDDRCSIERYSDGLVA